MGFATPGSVQNQKTQQVNATKSKVQTVPMSKIDFRINPEIKYIPRYATNIPSLDEFLGGGLPSGLTIVWGSAGSGKSLFARQCAENIGSTGKVLYFCCEVLTDAPRRSNFPNIDTVDYTTYRPNYKQAVTELFSFIEHMKPDLVVIDSITSFLGVTNKAISEASIRDAVWDIHLNAEGLCPIIGISEVRGTGFSRTTAGGEGVKHGCSMLLQCYKHFLTTDRYAEGFKDHDVGDVVYTLEVQKDKQGLARNTPCEVTYEGEGQYLVKPRQK